MLVTKTIYHVRLVPSWLRKSVNVTSASKSKTLDARRRKSAAVLSVAGELSIMSCEIIADFDFQSSWLRRTSMPKALSQDWRLRRLYSALWQAEAILRSPSRSTLPCAGSLRTRSTLSDYGRSILRLWSCQAAYSMWSKQCKTIKRFREGAQMPRLLCCNQEKRRFS